MSTNSCIWSLIIKSEYYRVIKRAVRQTEESPQDFIAAVEREVAEHNRHKFFYTCKKCEKKFGVKEKRIKRKFCSQDCKIESQRGKRGSIYDTLSDKEKKEKLRGFFEKHVLRGKDCWEWKGCKSSNRYGKLGFNKKSLSAHRVSWELHKGEIPAGMYVCHRCDYPPCTNPAHLYLGTPKRNSWDAIKKGKFGKYKITLSIMKSIRDYVLNGNHYMVPMLYGVPLSAIDGLKKTRMWKYIED